MQTRETHRPCPLPWNSRNSRCTRHPHPLEQDHKHEQLHQVEEHAGLSQQQEEQQHDEADEKRKPYSWCEVGV